MGNCAAACNGFVMLDDGLESEAESVAQMERAMASEAGEDGGGGGDGSFDLDAGYDDDCGADDGPHLDKELIARARSLVAASSAAIEAAKQGGSEVGGSEDRATTPPPPTPRPARPARADDDAATAAAVQSEHERHAAAAWNSILDFLSRPASLTKTGSHANGAKAVRNMFLLGDADGNGSLSVSELSTGLAGLGVVLTTPQLLAFHADADVNGDGEITLAGEY